jgi:hypothetical protein
MLILAFLLFLKGFQSRSFQSFQEALEQGEAAHLMPVFNAKERIKRLGH